MHELLSAEQMQRADALAIASGIDSYTLMQNAAHGVARTTSENVGTDAKVVVLAGPGNNGGDAMLAARYLADAGFRPTLVTLAADRISSQDASRALSEALTLPERHELDFGDTLPAAVAASIAAADVVIDGLFGAGLARDLDGIVAELVHAVNQSSAIALAIDLPSGIDGNSNTVRGCAIEAAHTVTFFRLKPAHLLSPVRSYCGEVHLIDIGIPARVLEDIDVNIVHNTSALWQSRLPLPAPDGNKFDRGHVAVRGGPLEKSGAGRLAAVTALTAGAGLATLAAPRESILAQAAAAGALMFSIAENSSDWMALNDDERIRALVIGPGNGLDDHTREAVLQSLDNAARDRAIVLDADALTVFASDPATLHTAVKNSQATVLMTPHDGEFARIFGELEGSRLHRCRAAAEMASCHVLLKGSDTVIAAPDGQVVISTHAPPWLATAGAGDVLAGLAASLLARDMPALDAAAAAAWIHGEAAWRLGYPVTADQLSSAIAQVLGDLKQDTSAT